MAQKIGTSPTAQQIDHAHVLQRGIVQNRTQRIVFTQLPNDFPAQLAQRLRGSRQVEGRLLPLIERQVGRRQNAGMAIEKLLPERVRPFNAVQNLYRFLNFQQAVR